MRSLSSGMRAAALAGAFLAALAVSACGVEGGTSVDEGTVQGLVRIVGTNTGVAGGTLDLSGPAVNRQVITGENGVFRFEDVPFGIFTLVLTPPDGWVMAQGSLASRQIQMAGGTAEFNFSITQGGGD